MAAKLITFITIQAVMLMSANSQYIKTVMPGAVIQGGPTPCGAIYPNAPYTGQSVILPSKVSYKTTVIEDSTVSSDLDAAIQLLLVNNMLCNGCPRANEFVLPPNSLSQYAQAVVAPQFGAGPVAVCPQTLATPQYGCGLPQYTLLDSALSPQSLIAPQCGCGCGCNPLGYVL